MDELYDESVFEGKLPLWFVLGEDFVEREPKTGRPKIVEPHPEAFCGADVEESRCIVAFTDEDLAQRHASQLPHTAAAGIWSLDELVTMLSAFYPNHFDSIIFDPGASQWTKNRKRIPEFIASFQTPGESP